ncbi:hypothetical protein ACFL6F_01535 [Planctomycetota bacterium]
MSINKHLIVIFTAVIVLCIACIPPKTEQKIGSVYFYLGDYFNNDAISLNENKKDGNFDTPDNPTGSSYPAEELPPGNAIVPVLEHSPLLIMFPPKKDGNLNNIACEGQILKGFTPQRFTEAYFIGSGTKGDQEGVFKFRFRDGTVTQRTLTFKDWCINKEKIEDPAIYSCSHRHNFEGKDEEISCKLFAVKTPLNPKRYLTSIQLPDNKDIHIFALTVMVPIRK